MALLEVTLAGNLTTALGNLSGPADIANAWGAYFKQAQLAGVFPVPAMVDAGALAMVGAMPFTQGASASGGAALFAAGVAAFWGHVQANIAAYWPGATPGTLPTGIGLVAGELVSAFVLNMDQSTTHAQAAARLAAVLHLRAGLGGAATIATVPVPIL